MNLNRIRATENPVVWSDLEQVFESFSSWEFFRGQSILLTGGNGLHATIARIFHTYGPQMKLDDGRVFADFIRDALEGKQIKLGSSGEAKRCFCYLSDATHGFLQLIVYGSSGEAYNLSNPSAETSIHDLAILVAGLSNPPLDVCFANGQEFKPGYIPSPVQRSLPSIAKLQSLGWQPVVNLRQGFSRTLDSYLIQN